MKSHEVSEKMAIKIIKPPYYIYEPKPKHRDRQSHEVFWFQDG